MRLRHCLVSALFFCLAGAYAAGPTPATKPKAAASKANPQPVVEGVLVPGAVFVPLNADEFANDGFGRPFDKTTMEVGGVPFQLAKTDHNCLSLKNAQWADWEKDLPWAYEGPTTNSLTDPKMPMLDVPIADYVAAHLLAVAEDDPGLTPAFTLRAGRFGPGGNAQYVQFDFAGQAARRGQANDAKPSALVQTSAGPLFDVTVPIPLAFAQDIQGQFMQIEVTKEVRLARRAPEPCRFRYRPLGLPSGVRIAAITLERSPLQMKVTGAETANAFVEPQKPQFKVSLENITKVAQEYTLTCQATHLDGSETQKGQSGRVEAGLTVEVSITLPVPKRGYYDLIVTLEDAQKRALLRRETSFALLPPDTRKHRDQSPFGTYDYGGGNGSVGDYDLMGPLYVKLGLHYGMFGDKAVAARRKFRLVKGNEPPVAKYNDVLAKNPDVPPMALMFHETFVSTRHLTRVPDLFVDWPAYQMDEKEQASFQKMWDQAVTQTKALRAQHPEVKIALGNDGLTEKEELYRHKFPAELFDSGGNEAGVYGTMPEGQPPNWLGNNSSIWMDRQLLDAYGYKDKPVSQCHEVCYPSTNPGNVDTVTEADYFVRHALHSLAWDIPVFRPGIITNVNGDYRFSDDGASGFCHVPPEMNVKPAFVEFATMTLVLDGAKFASVLPSGSDSVFAMEFDKADDASKVFPLWTIRARPVNLKLEGPGPWKLMDGQGNESPFQERDGKYTVTVSGSPVYVLGKGTLTVTGLGQPRYADAPDANAQVIAPLDSMADWTVETAPSPELEYYDFMTPRRQGDFVFEAVSEFEGQSGAIKVTPKPISHGKPTMAMYAVLDHKAGIPLPGTPTEIGLTINGNSGWGRVIFELKDASGQRWVSIGAQAKDDATTLLPPWMVDKFPNAGVSDWNNCDPWSVSQINFDGWRYVGFPLPGNYPGEGYRWAANSNWRWDKDGQVHYPLTLTKLVMELNEKVLTVKTFAPPPRPEIYLRDLVISQGDTVKVKKSIGEYVPTKDEPRTMYRW